MRYNGDYALGSSVVIKFTTTNGSGAPVAPSAALTASDFRVYKGSGAAQKTTSNGITVTSPFDSVTGRHQIVIDTSVDTGDVGFWSSGSDYFVEINSAKTVDGQVQTGVEVGSFSIENRFQPIFNSSSTIPSVERGVTDETPLYFTFPTGSLLDANFTKTKRINGGSSSTVSGTITYLYEINGKHWYRLAYNAADRPGGSAAGVVQFVFQNGGETRTVNMHVVESAGASLDAGEIRAAVGLSSANLDTQLGNIPTVAEFNARTLPSADYFVTGDYTAPDNASIAAILADTNELQANQGNWVTATGFSTHTAADVASEILATPANKLTTNVSGQVESSNMRGTDNAMLAASYVAPDNASISDILSDTNELQLNQGNWVTATGFSTHSAADVVTAMQTVANDFKADTSGLATSAQVSTVDANVDAILTDTGSTIPGMLTTITNYIDTEVAAIKAKTDNLPNDPATETTIAAVDALVTQIKAVTDLIRTSTRAH